MSFSIIPLLFSLTSYEGFNENIAFALEKSKTCLVGNLRRYRKDEESDPHYSC